jgi:hypothetical protein
MPNKPFSFRPAFSIIFISAILGLTLSSLWIAGSHLFPVNYESFIYHIPPPQTPGNFPFQECVSHSVVNTSNVIGAGGHFYELVAPPEAEKYQWPPSGHTDRACWVDAVKNINRSSQDRSLNVVAILPSQVYQLDLSSPLLADGQFVWGPNVGDFNIREFLKSIGSPLEPYSDDIEIWARYSSTNPKVLLTVLELQQGYVNSLSDDLTPEMIRETIENTSMDLAVAFYEHLHTWGSRKSTEDQIDADINPAVVFADGSAAQLSPDTYSGTFAIAATLAESTDMTTWLKQVSPQDEGGFTSVFGSLFPETDPLDNSNNINPPSLPAADFFQFPFPLGAIWYFGGPHSWAGDDTRPFSSMDFYAGGATCDAPPNLYTVAAQSGTAIRPYGYDCWLEIDHGGGWTTSYYHLQNMIDPQGATVNQNASLGTIACEICAGGWASGPHVHWTLKFGGAFVSLEGVRVSGWTIHVGPEPYDTGSIEREGQILDPFSAVLNDYHQYYPQVNTSLRFYGNGENDIDRIKISINRPPRPVDLGSTDFTLEWWMKANPGENNAGSCTPGGESWESGNHIFDRSVYQEDGSGELGVSLADGRITFGVNNGAESDTLCGITDIADGNWHHVAIIRGLDGSMRIYTDGTLDAETTGPLGDISYPDGRAETHPSDPYLVIGSEKFDQDPILYPSFSGWIDEIHFSSVIRYVVDFTPSTDPTSPDGNSVGLYHFDEGMGDFINDTSGSWGGPNNGALAFGGDPAGPEWSTDTPYEYVASSGDDSIGLYDEFTSTFFLKNELSPGSADISFRFGPKNVGWVPIAGDWDGDGATTIGLYDPVGGKFYLRNAHAGGVADEAFRFGPKNVGWVPITGDWDSDGTTTVGLYDPVGGNFYLRNTHAGGVADEAFGYGPKNAGLVPIAGDWDGDGMDTVGLYNPVGGHFYLRNAHAGGVADEAFGFGPKNVGWVPIAGDWDADGIDTVGLYYPVGGNFYLRNAHVGGVADEAFGYGPKNAGWLPIAGDWDGY